MLCIPISLEYRGGTISAEKTKWYKRKVFVISCFLLIAISLLLGPGALVVYMFHVRSNVNKANDKRSYILYDVDHHQLLRACRNVIKDGFSGRYEMKEEPHPETHKFPEIILSLEPHSIHVNEQRVGIQIQYGLIHFGVVAYAEDFKGPIDSYVNKKLIDGLWYYDIGYVKRKDFDKDLELLRPN